MHFGVSLSRKALPHKSEFFSYFFLFIAAWYTSFTSNFSIPRALWSPPNHFLSLFWVDIQWPYICCPSLSFPYFFLEQILTLWPWAWSKVHSLTHLPLRSASIFLKSVITQLLHWTLGQENEKESLKQFCISSKLITVFRLLWPYSFAVREKQLMNILRR